MYLLLRGRGTLGLALSLCLGLMTQARADLPLTIEDLLTAQQRWRVELSTVYANSTTTSVASGDYVLVQTGPTQVVAVPTLVGERQRNSDTWVLTPGLRYGWSGDTEIYGRGSWLSSSQRSFDASGSQTQSDERFADAWLGINHRFIKESDTPALLGFLEVAAAEKSPAPDSAWSHARSWLAGFTTYRILDPVVLSATVAYHLNQARDNQGKTYDPGDLILINPSIGFVANSEITLTSGLQWQWRQEDRLEGKDQGIRTTQTSLQFGLGYAWSQRLTLNINTRAQVSGEGNAEVQFTALYKLGELPKRVHGKGKEVNQASGATTIQ